MDTAAALSTSVAAGRIAIGLGLMLAPTQVGGPWIGRAAGQKPTQVMVRGLGVRDVALGAATLGTLKATGTSGMGFKTLTGLTIMCDLVDAAATCYASDEVPGGGRLSMAVAGGAALAGAATLAIAAGASSSDD